MRNGDPGMGGVAGASVGAAWWRAAGRSWLAGIGLLVLCGTVYLPGLWTIPPIDRDESRFAQASRQMIASGDFVVPRVQDRPRLAKPPLVYWAQSAAVAAVGERGPHQGIGVYRLPSALATTLAVILTWRLGLRMFDPRAAWLGAALLAVCPLVVADAHQARADQVLLACTTGAQLALWCAWRSDRAGALLPAVCFWVAVALGMLAKGPVTPMVSGLTLAGVCWASRDWSLVGRLRPLLGAGIVTLLVGPWTVALLARVGWSTGLAVLADEVLARGAAPKEGHWGPPGYHLVLLGILFWPGSLLTGVALGWAVRRAFPAPGPGRGWRARVRATLAGVRAGVARSPACVFLLAWIIPSWIIFELYATKLPHYVLPMYPAVALLSARVTMAAAAGAVPAASSAGARLGRLVWLGVGGALVMLPLAGFWFTEPGMPSPGPSPVTLAAGVIVGAACLSMARSALRAGAFTDAVLYGVCATCVTVVGLFQALLPSAEALWISPHAASAVAHADPGGTRPLAAAGYVEDSFLFLTRGRAVRIEESDARAWLRAHPDGLLVASSRAAATVPEARVLSWTTGINYARARRETVWLLEGGP